MAQKYLGDFFDVHCGGEDHIPVHERDRADRGAWTRLANFWLHGFLLSDAKMAKSAGEFLRIAFVERGYDPLAFRSCLTGHHLQLNFTWMRSIRRALRWTACAIHALRDAGEAPPDAALIEASRTN